MALCHALVIEFGLLSFHCDPFLHGYGKTRSKSQMAIGIWKPPVADVNGIKGSIQFYITRGDGFLLLGNKMLYKIYEVRLEGFVKITSGYLSICHRELHFQTCFEPTSDTNSETARTNILVAPSKFPSFKSLFSICKSLLSNSRSQFQNNQVLHCASERKFACKLHFYTHFHPSCMSLIKKEAGVFPILWRKSSKNLSKAACLARTLEDHRIQKNSHLICCSWTSTTPFR